MKKLSRNQPIPCFDVILQLDWPVEKCLLHIRIFFGGKTQRPCFDLSIHWLIKQITNTYRNHFSRSYETRSMLKKYQYSKILATCRKLRVISPWLLYLHRGVLGVLINGGAKAPCKRTQHCRMLHVASVCSPCCMLLRVVAQSLKPVKLFSQQLPTFLLFRDRRSVEQQDAVGAYIWACLFLAYVKFVMCMRDMWVVQWYCVFEG